MPWIGYIRKTAMKLLHITRRLSLRISATAICVLVCAAVVAGFALSVQQSSERTYSPHGAIKISCTNCHTTTSWKPIRPFPDFSHASTGYPLQGMHAALDCRQCHLKLVFSNVGKNCADCHADIHRRQMGSNCEQCHTIRGWGDVRRNPGGHENRFPLLGAHAATSCQDCHKSAAVGLFKGLSTQCVSCHQADYLSARVIDHQAAGFSTNCESCHQADNWQRSLLDHAKVTGFALLGAHASLQCTQCHIGGKFSGTPADCIGCHLKDYNAATNPDHVQANFPKDCSVCHTTNSWQGTTFNHNATKFPLTGAHSGIQCIDCHKNGQYAGLPTACISCHLADFNGTTNPNHVTSGFPQDCTICHATTAWNPASFDHSKTQFPLTGAHASRQCVDCHKNGQYTGLSTACASCHLSDFTGSKNPDHVAAGFSQVCSTCHSTIAWTPSIFDHNTSKFPLTGAHAGQKCSACHASGQYATLPTTCVSCHLTDFNGTTNPNHTAAGFPQDCSVCHSTTAWTPALFDHSKTKFPLTGAHAPLQCPACHSSGQYANLPTACVSCHLANFNGASNPNHVSAGFPQDCTICHSTSAWSPSIFNHSKTNFPLTGAHTSVQCALCHISGIYAGTPTDCYSCHSKEYTSTTDPNHVAALFPKTCDSCHSTSSWSGATFNHAQFPIYSGSHAGRWTSCGDCHTNSNNYSVFSCITCHTHDKATTDSQHQGVSNYVYNSANCYSCHPTGRTD